MVLESQFSDQGLLPHPKNVLWNRVNITIGKFCFLSLSLNSDEQDLFIPCVRR